MRKTLHTAILILTVCLVQFFTVATLKVLNAGAPGGQAPASGGLDCVSGDVNNDDALNIADAIYVLTYLFNGGPEPVACAGNPTEVVVTNTPDVNVVNTAAVEVTNTPDVNIANIPSVTVTNIPEVIVTNTADINVVSIPSVVISSMPLVSDDFVSALGQFFPKAGNYLSESVTQLPGDISLLPVLTVPEGKVFRFERLTHNVVNQLYYWFRVYVDGEDITQYLSADAYESNLGYREGYNSNGLELLPGQVLSVRRYNTNYSSYQISCSVQGYFLDYTP